ncbi:unnamed protein product [Rotaria sordida]|nr:unnamed protein product [Rotaria sordida]CAF1036175.1 unnamed protein product [Rotaria sordida]CAF3864805.1 unnamed protein product [Rotaria sordida]CAF4030332.1 unnamed protein product [Rotaria sordida]
MFLIFGVSSINYNQVKIPERDFQYIINNLQIEYRMNYEDAKRCVLELEHFYTGIKYKIIDNILEHPSTAIKNAWESHIVYTSMYFNFIIVQFGRTLFSLIPLNDRLETIFLSYTVLSDQE